jgi:uncharacterized protein
VHLFYLHGFASSPDSAKARFLRERFEARGLALRAPDFNQPDFSTLTVTRMLGQLDEAIDALAPGPVVLIGSSLGGFVALHAAAARATRPAGHPITHLVLLAPALDFASDRDTRLTRAELDEWRRTNRREVFHFSYNRSLPVHFDLYADGHGYDAFAVSIDTPTLVWQGVQDTIVNPANARAWAAPRPHVTLHLLDDDHQLKAGLERIWEGTAAFLGIGPARG